MASGSVELRISSLALEVRSMQCQALLIEWLRKVEHMVTAPCIGKLMFLICIRPLSEMSCNRGAHSPERDCEDQYFICM
jgi:hypothetical protein